MAVSHFLSVHTPATAARKPPQRPYPGAAAQGGGAGEFRAGETLVDDEALLSALKSGHLFAAGLDVYAREPALHPGYRTLPNVFLLPHLGTATLETRTAMGFRALDNVDAVLSGREP